MAFFPKIFEYYKKKTLESTKNLIPDCSRCHPNLPFAKVTLNIGRQSVCHAHCDGCNLPGGHCMVSPNGNYNHATGGHLILHELRMVIALPPGSIIFFP